MKHWKKMTLIALVWLPTVACGPQNATTNQAGAMSGRFPAVGSMRNANVTQPGRGALVPRVAPDHRVRVEQAIAQRVVRTAHVRSASVLLAGRSAYVAVELTPGSKAGLVDQTKKRISSIVKASHPAVTNVYVTANPDAYHHFQRLATDIGQGRPISGLWNNFRSVVTRVWPTAK